MGFSAKESNDLLVWEVDGLAGLQIDLKGCLKIDQSHLLRLLYFGFKISGKPLAFLGFLQILLPLDAWCEVLDAQ